MKNIFVFCLFFFISVNGNSQTVLKVGSYRLTNLKIVSIGVTCAGGLVDGILAGYEFDGRTSFERKWGVSPTSFWGSESWKRAYKNNDPSMGFKNNYVKWRGANDFYHVADDMRKMQYLAGGIIIGIGPKTNTKWWHYVVDFGLSYGASAVFKAAGLGWIRH